MKQLFSVLCLLLLNILLYRRQLCSTSVAKVLIEEENCVDSHIFVIPVKHLHLRSSNCLPCCDLKINLCSSLVTFSMELFTMHNHSNITRVPARAFGCCALPTCYHLLSLPIIYTFRTSIQLYICLNWKCFGICCGKNKRQTMDEV